MTTTRPTFTVGELLKKARIDAGLDQGQLARALGVARNTVSNYETGRSIPTLDVAVNWARVTGVPLEWLAEGVVRPEGLEPPTFWSVADALTDRCYMCNGGPVIVTADDRTMQTLYCFACGRFFSIERPLACQVEFDTETPFASSLA